MIRTPINTQRTIVFDYGFIDAATGAIIAAPNFANVTVVMKLNPADSAIAPSTEINAIANTLTSNAISIDADTKHPKMTLLAGNVDVLGHAQIIMTLAGAVELVQLIEIEPLEPYNALVRGIAAPEDYAQ